MSRCRELERRILKVQAEIDEAERPDYLDGRMPWDPNRKIDRQKIAMLNERLEDLRQQHARVKDKGGC